MGTSKRMGWAGACVLAVGLAAAPAAWAGEGTSTYMSGMWRKLGRGIANVATFPLEIPRTSSIVGRSEGGLAAWTAGTLQGAWRGLVRGATGVFEIVTFYAEIPEGFEPLFKPEYVWTAGNWAE